MLYYDFVNPKTEIYIRVTLPNEMARSDVTPTLEKRN